MRGTVVGLQVTHTYEFEGLTYSECVNKCTNIAGCSQSLSRDDGLCQISGNSRNVRIR